MNAVKASYFIKKFANTFSHIPLTTLLALTLVLQGVQRASSEISIACKFFKK